MENILVSDIQRWLALEKYLKQLNEKTKSIRDQKTELSGKIRAYIYEHRLENAKIELPNGELRLYEKKDYSPLTFAFVEQCLAELIPEKSQVEYVMEYLRSKREVKITPDIRRVYSSST